MASHLKFLLNENGEVDVEKWNSWREKNPDVKPDLSEENLKGANLFKANLENTKLIRVNLKNVNLKKANLKGANFFGANLENIQLSNVVLENNILIRVNLKSAKLQKTEFKNVDLIEANLENTNLREANLENVNLLKANLENAELRKAQFKNVDLRETNLKSVNFREANLEDINFLEANLEDAQLVKTGFRNSDFRGANLKNADLSQGKLQTTIFNWANLENANLSEAGLENTILRNANLKGTNLKDTNLMGADLRDCLELRLDNTFIRNTRFSSNATDPWSILRRKYTGTSFFVILIAMVVFILPYGTGAFVWLGVSRVQETITTQIPVEFCLNCEPRRIVYLLLNTHRGPFFFATTLIVIIYNILRAIVTFTINPLREEEERSGNSPNLGMPLDKLLVETHKLLFNHYHYKNWPSYINNFWKWKGIWPSKWEPFWQSEFVESYLWVYHVHKALRWLFWITIISTTINTIRLLIFTKVDFPI